jgi:hypothetical protein
MSTIYKTKTVAIPGSGVSLFHLVKECLVLSVTRGEPIEFEFNGTSIVVDADKAAGEIMRDQYDNARQTK